MYARTSPLRFLDFVEEAVEAVVVAVVVVEALIVVGLVAAVVAVLLDTKAEELALIPSTHNSSGSSMRSSATPSSPPLIGRWLLRLPKVPADSLYRPTERVFTMRGITSQPAEKLKFLLSGRDGGKDRMISVTEYFRGEQTISTN